MLIILNFYARAHSFAIVLSSFFFCKSLIKYEDSSVTQINVKQVDQKCLDHTKLGKNNLKICTFNSFFLRFLY